ncbi:MAG TPA: CBS domain-containing protein [Planctomycetota bacterium]|nr:CBS domain-containing protein [Planctomycetota bacterium]
MIVRQWMSSKFVLLPIETSLVDALRFLNSKGIALVGVLRHGHIAGAVTRSEIYEMLETGDPMTLLSRKTLACVVPPTATIVYADDPVDRAARYIAERGLPAVPVMQKDEMVGIITPPDLCRALCEIMGSRSPEASMVMTLTTPRGSDLLTEIGRRCEGLSLQALIAYPTITREWQVMLRMKGEAPKQATVPTLPATELAKSA